MIVEQVDMTPAMAKSLLAGNDKNRAPHEVRVQVLVAQMLSGSWKMNGETIIVSETGRLLDGQHRLAAVIVAKKSIPMLIVRGAKDEDLNTIDTGRSRSGADIVGMMGFRHRAEAAAAAAVLYRLFTGTSQAVPIPPQYLVKILERFPSLDGWADRYRHSQDVRRLIGGGTLIPILTYLSDVAKRPELAASLFDGIASGTKLSQGDPILALRNRLIRMKTAGDRMGVMNCWVGFVRVVDAMETGKTLDKAMFTRTSEKLIPPAKFMDHLERMETNPVDDMPRPERVARMRTQKELMNRLVNK